jgi:hypothetical protein
VTRGGKDSLEVIFKHADLGIIKSTASVVKKNNKKVAN